MTVECINALTNAQRERWTAFLCGMDLEPDYDVESTVFIWDGEKLAATGSRQKNVLKCIAIDPAYQGEGLTATLLTHLRQDAFSAGYKRLFLYTKPANETIFTSLFFYPVAKTETVLLMENTRNGPSEYLSKLDVPCNEGEIGAVVMHCNPFTNGHRYLIETAARQCQWLYVFVLSEESGDFPAADRIELVRQGTQDLENVTVLPTGQYLISAATFPSYFLKDTGAVNKAHCELDVAVFSRYFVPHFGITHRFVGTEPTCAVTRQYNETLKKLLPMQNVSVVEIPRLEKNAVPISAGRVRELFSQQNWTALEQLVPQSTLSYLKNTGNS